jgi:hypothetical protein
MYWIRPKNQQLHASARHMLHLLVLFYFIASSNHVVQLVLFLATLLPTNTFRKNFHWSTLQYVYSLNGAWWHNSLKLWLIIIFIWNLCSYKDLKCWSQMFRFFFCDGVMINYTAKIINISTIIYLQRTIEIYWFIIYNHKYSWLYR